MLRDSSGTRTNFGATCMKDLATVRADSCFPPPPRFEHTELAVPPYTPWDHPNTKWILNTFRSGANARLAAMSKEHPNMFDYVFQIPDTPEKVTWNSGDYEPMYKRSTVLYLRPLSLAVYMRKLDVITLLIENYLVDNSEVSFATDTANRAGASGAKKIREIRPVTIAIRRNILDSLPIIFNARSGALKASDPFTLRYANKWMEKCNKFKDAFDYAISVVRKGRILPIARLFDVLVFHCPGYCTANSAQRMCTNHGGVRCSLFQRLARYLISEGGGNRLTLPLIQSMEQLIIHRGFYKPTKNVNCTWFGCYCFANVATKWDAMPTALQDCLVTLALMIKLHEIFLEKAKTSVIPQTTGLISKMALSIGCRNDLLISPAVEIQKSIKFLLEVGFMCCDVCGIEGGDSKQVERRSSSSKAAEMMAPPSRRALEFLLSGMETYAQDAGLKRRPGFTEITVGKYNTCVPEPESDQCLLCLKEAEEKFPLADPLPVGLQRDNMIGSDSPLLTTSEAVRSSESSSSNALPAVNHLPDRSSLLDAKGTTVDFNTPNPTMYTKESLIEQSDNPELINQEIISSPRVLEEATFCGKTEESIVSPMSEEEQRATSMIQSDYQQGEQCPDANSTNTLPSGVVEILMMNPVDNDTEVDQEANSATNRLKRFLEESELDECSRNEQPTPTFLDPTVSVHLHDSEAVNGTSTTEIPPGAMFFPDATPGPCSLLEVDQLIQRIASSDTITKEMVLSETDSGLIDDMLQECLNKTKQEPPANNEDLENIEVFVGQEESQVDKFAGDMGQQQ
ncbi:unnamed protein product [Mesocestoides corti]|uniref:ANK_REP_REGION domain-containing protein n=1 Tax=Mesocestoides corti TaxID=53468 RepID=A0A0R3UMX4_MESCO|nr:unnamed protein product [Mesocestoides corti]